MDMSSSALFPEIRMKYVDDEDNNYIFSGLDDTLPEVDYDPDQFQQKSFKDNDEFGSVDQFIKAMMEEDDENAPAMAPQSLECSVENVNSQISALVTDVPSLTTTSSSDFVNSNYELMQSPSSFNFISMILEEAMIDNTDDNVDGYTDNNGSNSVATKCSGSNKRSRSIGRNHTQIKDHILSERRRREKLSQLFIALAAMVPDLKKTDKASILGGAIHHMKQLKEKEASLKHKVNNRKKVQIRTTRGKEILSSESSLSSTSSTALMSSIIGGNINVKYEGKHILIRINIDNIKKGDIINLLRGIEMDGLTITNSCFFPFGNSALAITVIAKMDELFSLTANELVTNLHSLIDQC